MILNNIFEYIRQRTEKENDVTHPSGLILLGIIEVGDTIR